MSFRLRFPPLRKRPEDIPGLVHYLLLSLGVPDAEISLDLMQKLQKYHWPGNVRELRNVLERALLLSHGNALNPEHFSWLEPAPSSEEQRHEDTSELTTMEGTHIKVVMQRFNNDTKKAAEALGISRATLYRKLKKL